MIYATTLALIEKFDMREKTDMTNGDKALIAFRPSHDTTEYQVVLDKGADTIWATEAQIADIFGRDRTVVNRHIKNAFKEGELDEDATSAKIALVRTEGGREIEREVFHYNLDVIISVGYRVKSPLATEFRKWDVYVSNGRMILEHNTARNTLDIYNYDSVTRMLNDQIIKGL